MLAISGLSFSDSAQPLTPEWGTMLSDGLFFSTSRS